MPRRWILTILELWNFPHGDNRGQTSNNLIQLLSRRSPDGIHREESRDYLC